MIKTIEEWLRPGVESGVFFVRRQRNEIVEPKYGIYSVDSMMIYIDGKYTIEVQPKGLHLAGRTIGGRVDIVHPKGKEILFRKILEDRSEWYLLPHAKWEYENESILFVEDTLVEIINRVMSENV